NHSTTNLISTLSLHYALPISANLRDLSKGYFATTFLSSSLLYRGGLVSSAFRLLRRSWFDVARRDPRFSSGSALWPSHDGIRRMRRTNLTIRPCRKTYGRHQDSKRTRLIHRPCGDIAPPGRRNSVFSYRYCAQLRQDMMSVTSVH